MVAILFFGVTFLRQANISYESRHMRLIGLIITPGVIYLIARLHRVYWVAFGLVWVFIAFVSFRYLATGYHRNSQAAAHGSTGIALGVIDQPTLNYIKALDQQQQNAIFVFTSADLGLEIQHNRIITFDPLGDDLTSDESIFPYKGHAGPLYILLPKSYIGAKANLYMSKFPGYQHFTPYPSGKHYIIYKGE